MSMARRSEHGFALLIVLWTLSLLALIGSQLLTISSFNMKLARNLTDAATLEAAADGAVQQAIYGLLRPDGGGWMPDGREYLLHVGVLRVSVHVANANEKVNPNIASEPLLRALLVRAGAGPAQAISIAAAMLDWRSGGDQPRPFGAKAPQYMAAGRDYAPPGSDFRSLDEVGAVLGMTPALMAGLRPHLTVFSDIDPDSATPDPVVAAALADLGEAAALQSGPATVVEVTAQAIGRRGDVYAERVVVRLNAIGARPFAVLGREVVSIP